TAADVLEHKDVPVMNQLRISPIDAVGICLPYSIRSATHDDRQRLSLLLRSENQRVQTHTVPRGDHLFSPIESNCFIGGWNVANPLKISGFVTFLFPNGGRNFTLSITNECCISAFVLQEKPQLTRGEDFDPGLVTLAEKEPIVFTEKRQNVVGVIGKRILAGEVIELTRVDFNFG